MSEVAQPAVLEVIGAALDLAGVDALFHARDLATGLEVGRNPDAPVVLASVFKIPIALELARQFDSGRLKPEQRVRVRADQHTAGDTGLSGLLDEVDISLRDLAQQMITVSDNTARVFWLPSRRSAGLAVATLTRRRPIAQPPGR